MEQGSSAIAKTVSWTGKVMEAIGGGCTGIGQDGDPLDRDYNGARGICVRRECDWLTLINDSIRCFLYIDM